MMIRNHFFSIFSGFANYFNFMSRFYDDGEDEAYNGSRGAYGAGSYNGGRSGYSGRGGYGDRRGGYGDRGGYGERRGGDGGYGGRGGSGDRGGYGDRRGGYGDRGGYGKRGGNGYFDNGHSIPAQDDPDFVPNWTERVDDFDSMGLQPELLQGVYGYGFKSPSEIQAIAIGAIRDKSNRHVIAQAQSGTGKTGAFSIGVLSKIDTTVKTTQALVLAPTRELATQIYNFFKDIGCRIPNLDVALFIGGQRVTDNQERASSHPHVCVCTPGRALDLINSGHLRVENFKMFVLDEADQMLSENFLDQINEIMEYIPEDVQILLFSATISTQIYHIMNTFMNDPIKILIKKEQLTLEGIKQFYVNVNETKNKFDCLLDIYGSVSIQKAIIFANSKTTVDYISSQLQEHGFVVAPIHAGLDQATRDHIMRDFRTGAARVLISTDLLARGIDVQQVTLVINFELPKRDEQYIHRIGRSGRYGRKGVAINICDDFDMETIEALKQHYMTVINELPSDIEKVINEANADVEEETKQ